MNLICNICGRKEEKPYEAGDVCYEACGGKFIYNSPYSEKDPTGRDQHMPGAKLDDGKVLAGILGDFGLALIEVAKVGTYGAKKYTRHGWEAVPNGIERYQDAKWRHLLAQNVDRFDNDTGFLHLAHECWNNLAALELTLRQELEE